MSLQNYLPLLKKAWLPFLIIFIFSLVFKQYFAEIVESSSYQPQRKVFALLGQIVTSFTASLFIFLTIPPVALALKKQTPVPHLLRFYRQHDFALVVESLRVFTRVLLWALLFIIPGLIKQVQYIFMPYIVVSDPRYYQDEDFDPLAESQKLVRGIFFPMVLLLIVSSVESFIDLASPSQSLGRYILILCGYLISIYFNAYLFFLYLIRRDQLSCNKAE